MHCDIAQEPVSAGPLHNWQCFFCVSFSLFMSGCIIIGRPSLSRATAQPRLSDARFGSSSLVSSRLGSARLVAARLGRRRARRPTEKVEGRRAPRRVVTARCRCQVEPVVGRHTHVGGATSPGPSATPTPQVRTRYGSILIVSDLAYSGRPPHDIGRNS